MLQPGFNFLLELFQAHDVSENNLVPDFRAKMFQLHVRISHPKSSHAECIIEILYILDYYLLKMSLFFFRVAKICLVGCECTVEHYMIPTSPNFKIMYPVITIM